MKKPGRLVGGGKWNERNIKPNYQHLITQLFLSPSLTHFQIYNNNSKNSLLMEKENFLFTSPGFHVLREIFRFFFIQTETFLPLINSF